MASWEEILDGIAGLTLLVRGALQDGLVELARELGYDLQPVAERLGALEQRLNELVAAADVLTDTLQKLADESPSSSQAGLVVKAVVDQAQAIRRLEEGFQDASLAQFVSEITAGKGADVLGREFLRRFIGWLLRRHLDWQTPALLSTLELAGIVETVFTEGDTATHRVSFTEVIIHPEGLSALLSKPADHMRSLYATQGHYLYDTLFSHLAHLSLLRMLPSSVYESDGLDLEEFTSVGPEVIQASSLPSHTLETEILGGHDNIVECRLRLLSVPGAGGADRIGLGIELLIRGGSETFFRDLTDHVTVCLPSKSDVMVTTRVLFVPNSLPKYAVTYEDGGSSELEAAIRFQTSQTAANFVLPGIGGIKLEKGALEIGLSVRGGKLLASGSLVLEGGQILIGCGDADAFLQRLLPQDGLEARFDLTLSIDTNQGLHIAGSGGLEVTVPCHLMLGPLTVESIYVAVQAAPPDVELLLGLNACAELGPIQASIKRVGGRLAFSGGKDLRFGFLPPTGTGLSLSAGPIVGGGHLDISDGNYSGMLALQASKIGLTAIALITTKMPDGSKGFSLLVSICTIFNPPIQLPYGFTLSGVGGLVGINRTMDVDVLRVGIKNRTLDSILFPDPSTLMANAPKILSDMRAVFPPEEGRFVVGPMVKLGWGKNIITADIGIFLDLPCPIRIVLLGQLEAILPEKENAIVIIHLDVLGVLDLEKQELTFQASLYDSRILAFPICGDAAFLLSWGSDPRFALSLGGFHPQFAPPPPPQVFADLKRLSISISSGSNLQLSCSAYQALTPNTLQYGSRVDLYASEGGATIKGNMGYDTLIYFSPFSFEVSMYAAVEITYEGARLASIDLSFLLSGPTPWIARGKAEIEVLFISVTVRFCITWGDDKKAALPAIDPWTDLQAALGNPDCWGAVLPSGTTMVEALRVDKNAPAGDIVVHPAGKLEIRQKVVPLEMKLSLAANAPIEVHDIFDIQDVKVAEVPLEITPVEEFFARGQWEGLGDRALSVPSFERMKAGVSAALDEVILCGGFESKPAAYESILIEKEDRTSKRQPKDGVLPWRDALAAVRAGVRRNAARRAGSSKRFTSPRQQPTVRVREEGYCIAEATNLKRADVKLTGGKANRRMTRTLADQALAVLAAEDGKYIVIPESEVAA